MRRGPSLLGGLLVCGRCGRHLLVSSTNAGRGLRSSCLRGRSAYGEPPCQSLSGRRLDALVSAQVLEALQPAALELHLAAFDGVGDTTIRPMRSPVLGQIRPLRRPEPPPAKP